MGRTTVYGDKQEDNVQTERLVVLDLLLLLYLIRVKIHMLSLPFDTPVIQNNWWKSSEIKFSFVNKKYKRHSTYGENYSYQLLVSISTMDINASERDFTPRGGGYWLLIVSIPSGSLHKSKGKFRGNEGLK